MKLIFRVDSSLEIGTGHVMRCLTLAAALAERGCEIRFICRRLPGDISALIESKGYPVHRLPAPDQMDPPQDDSGPPHAGWLGVHWLEDAKAVASTLPLEKGRPDWLVVDHYALDYRWEEYLRSRVSSILVIDDLADRPHNCDVLLDQNLHPDPDSRYLGLVPVQCTLLIGPHYALLRREFSQARKAIERTCRDGRINSVLILFGGIDPTNETAKALTAIASITAPSLAVQVVAGANNPHKLALSEYCENFANHVFYEQSNELAELMSQADLAIGAGGTITWERCCLGLPAIVISVAKNQEAIAKEVAAAGAIRYLGGLNETGSEEIRHAILELIHSPSQVRQMSENAVELVDCEGVNRVVSSIVNSECKKS